MSRFERMPRDLYRTPPDTAALLARHLPAEYRFIAPCAGDGGFVQTLEAHGHHCAYAADIEPLAEGITRADGAQIPAEYDGLPVIENPPFSRTLFRRLMLSWLEQGREVWALMPLGYLANEWTWKAGLPQRCHEVLMLPRVQWFANEAGMKETRDHVFALFKPEDSSAAALRRVMA